MFRLFVLLAAMAWGSVAHAQTGGVIRSHGPDIGDIIRRVAPYVDRILRGAKPAELPVQVPVKFEMALNMKRRRGSAWTFLKLISTRQRGDRISREVQKLWLARLQINIQSNGRCGHWRPASPVLPAI
jgi:hypothetical protein